MPCLPEGEAALESCYEIGCVGHVPGKGTRERLVLVETGDQLCLAPLMLLVYANALRVGLSAMATNM